MSTITTTNAALDLICSKCGGRLFFEEDECYCLQCGHRIYNVELPSNPNNEDHPPVLHDYKNQLSGRCWYCNIRFIWDKKGTSAVPKRLKDALCPICNGPLKATTYKFTTGRTMYRLPNKRKKN